MKLVISPKFLTIGFMLICAAQVIVSMEGDLVKLAPGGEYNGITWTYEEGGKGGTLSNPRGQKLQIHAAAPNMAPLTTSSKQQYLPHQFLDDEDKGIIFRIGTIGNHQ
ncbi:uncharacterized protein MELLADRAFT_102036 [Melampsora larici-populina 98AG31]|uniref:Secreted protein n=1 Tax=Melampsora larici-populina (strain 98AG31 / pathotype 3-4-7) TaxID=747676 RepID=F4R5S0_MELLP|nr:uncharacterized protein MELLADRAFT_102036 [Melampsora larici-populina 98AG31]EGG12209.1 secreted protein [Melampsora larici-populina 98AG31]